MRYLRNGFRDAPIAFRAIGLKARKSEEQRYWHDGRSHIRSLLGW